MKSEYQRRESKVQTGTPLGRINDLFSLLTELFPLLSDVFKDPSVWTHPQGQSSHMDQAVINSVYSGPCNSSAPAPTFQGDLRGMAKGWSLMRENCRRSQSYQLGKGEWSSCSPGQSVLHTSVEPKYCFSSYIVTIKTELGEWCQSPVSRTVMHWTISLRDNWGHSETEFVPGLEVQGSDCWWGLKSGSWEKTFQQRSSETRMIHWGWIREFILFDVPCVWRDHIGADLFYKRRISEKNLYFSLVSAGFSSRWDQWELVDL